MPLGTHEVLGIGSADRIKGQALRCGKTTSLGTHEALDVGQGCVAWNA